MTSLNIEPWSLRHSADVQRGGSFMTVIPFHVESIVLAAPMMVLLLVRVFWIDEMLSRPGKAGRAGHPLSGCDKDGHAICVEPDGALRGHTGPVQRGRKLHLHR
jgi:hypothetical protein